MRVSLQCLQLHWESALQVNELAQRRKQTGRGTKWRLLLQGQAEKETGGNLAISWENV